MKIRGSTKVVFGFILAVGAVVFGYQAYAKFRVDGIQFKPIKPSRVNLIAVSTGQGYRIIVANGVAQLSETSNQSFDAPEVSGNESEDDTNKKRVPIADLLKTLQGDEVALGKMVMTMNELKDSDLPPPPRRKWTAEDIQKALDGDKALQGKLVNQLNVDLDGNPLPRVDTYALMNGIVLDLPVKINVIVGAEEREMTGRILEAYTPRFVAEIQKKLEDKAFTNEMIRGRYEMAASELAADQRKKEDVRDSLKARIDPARLATFAVAPNKILSHAKVIVNDSMMSNASYRNYQLGDRKLNDLKIELSEEGRLRLWQYSRGKTGFQLLLVVDGVAIAAPRIRHELSQSDITITQLTEESLVKDAVDVINAAKPGGK